MLTKRVRRLLSVAAMAPLLLTSCDSNPFDPFEDALGTYDLTIFATNSVPVDFDCAPAPSPNDCEGMPNGGTLRVNGGTLTLHDDGTFVEINNFTEFETGQSSQPTNFTSSGTFTLSGENLELSDQSQGRFIDATVRFSGSRPRISYFEAGESYEYIQR